ncbi:MAG: hypothetical protein HUU54_02620 [Ignavibacteriaceae bacterium]|nr:hypothetical protein [Ignavibacteriaceae bacterium]
MKKKFKLEIIKKSDKALFLSVIFSGSSMSLFQEFAEKYYPIDPGNCGILLDSIDKMADFGIQSTFFKYQRSNYVYRFLDSGTLRLYCLKYDDLAIIIGGGGVKPHTVKNLREIPELDLAVKILEAINKKLLLLKIKITELQDYLDIDFEIDL